MPEEIVGIVRHLQLAAARARNIGAGPWWVQSRELTESV